MTAAGGKNAGLTSILRPSLVMAGSSIVNMGLGLIRMKVAAVLLGPTGIGVIGLLQSMLLTISSVATFGIQTTGPRLIADSNKPGGVWPLHDAKTALYVVSVFLAALATLAVFLFRNEMSQLLSTPAVDGGAVGILSVGVGFSVLAAANLAYLNGLQLVREMALATIIGALFSSAVATVALLLGGDCAPSMFVVAVPMAAAVVSGIFVAKQGPWIFPSASLRSFASIWTGMARLGLAIVASALIGSLIQLFTRSYIEQQAGVHALGIFQSAWTISLAYVSVVLVAMSKVFYPQVVAEINNHKNANTIINDQTELAVLMSSPLFIIMVGFTPVIIRIMYTDEFLPAVELLRFQAFGDVIRVLSFSLALRVLAAGKGLLYFLFETMATLVWSGTIIIALPTMGLPAAGVGFFLMFVVYLPAHYVYARSEAGFHFRSSTLKYSGACIVFMAATVGISQWSEIAASSLAVVGSIAFSGIAMNKLGLWTRVKAILRGIKF